ncbi:LOW QUALITY PROTEIN: acrosin-like [Vidua macroura]|uniref:LOW QUALITY PROTEIN: acrosin-like n=1 Tax=Vidua macroura TaxID=187451 RepID=UPI0023A7F2F5|nr:LOW QUALITY PROTEIN: acrosin-like [Vidua macroura]
MALLALLVLLALAGPVWATWDTCRGTCGLRPLAFDHSSLVRDYDPTDGDYATLGSSDVTSLVMDGPGVPSGTWPGIVSVQATLENGTWHMCSGALIHPQWVLTVAQCFARAGDISIYEVVMGTADVAQPGPEAAVRRIQRLLVHQNYVAATARNNIALLELDQPVECSDYIQLGCVPDSSLAVPELKTCYMAGWRATPDSAPGPRLVLQEAKVRLIDVQLCNSSRWYGGAVHPQDLCAGYPRGGIDTCQGDSGGPLVCKDHVGDYFWLVGLASWGKGCTGEKRPGVFTSTQHFRGWIQVQMGMVPADPTPTPTEPAPTPAPSPILSPTPPLTLTVIEKPPEPESQPFVTISFPKAILLSFLGSLQRFLEFLRDKLR